MHTPHDLGIFIESMLVAVVVLTSGYGWFKLVAAIGYWLARLAGFE